MGRLNGKVAIITGGNSGIGFATARKFHEEGASVVISARNKQLLDSAAKELGEDILAIQGDITQVNDVQNVVNQVVAQFGRIDIVFANAGLGEFTDFPTADGNHYDEIFDVNVKGVVSVIQTAMPYLKSGASIVINGSISGLTGFQRLHAYSASKGAVCALTRSLAAELAGSNIRVNAISPGLIDTPIHVKMGVFGKDIRENAEKSIPLKRIGTSQEVANVVSFLASDEASYMTGTNIVVDGGLTEIQ
ncbi:SDR family oxidoreductase [Endozoicomonas sp. SM1973]|uniref:SDR family oxidoreductase n=1 Tax=Spartinivicinus marinus TaxID=2994442 RepID=A0A853IEA8_9GAMM|nr:glucose 1-dehydrogenase [Spartinivicinus marinus]MCX4029815.1 SDR family oxidoreductase [Spartinivicinus marinus]NYZ67515.1 SDR family oxidoreductase [Spartinivicinus marinus]